jgi:signal transduction histidine kinase
MLRDEAICPRMSERARTGAKSGETEAGVMESSRERSSDELRRIAGEQAALRRVAMLVARGAGPDDVLAAVAGEVGVLFDADATGIGRYDPDGKMTMVASHGYTYFKLGMRHNLSFHPALAAVRQTGRAVRFEADDPAWAALPEEYRAEGWRSAAGAPIVVQDRVWGIIGVASRRGPLPPDAVPRLADFTELAAVAIANAEAHAELMASRARIVATADDTRRRIERDLHDGAQQRVVSLALQLREVQAAAPPEAGELVRQLDNVAAGLEAVLEELREIAHGIHPALLAEHGFGPALKALARRSPIPVDLQIRAEGRLPERVEAGAYYIICEALTNTAKHAHASAVTVAVEAAGQNLHVMVGDDGIGGADFTHGTGLAGLKDRVEALGGRISLHSPPGAGTTLQADLPLTDAHGATPNQPISAQFLSALGRSAHPVQTLRRYWPPTSKNASVICCRLHTRAASISTANTFSPSLAASLSASRAAGASAACRAWKSRTRSSWDFFSSSVARARGIDAAAAASACGLRKVLTPMTGSVPSCLRRSYSIDSSWIRPRW